MARRAIASACNPEPCGLPASMARLRRRSGCAMARETSRSSGSRTTPFACRISDEAPSAHARRQCAGAPGRSAPLPRPTRHPPMEPIAALDVPRYMGSLVRDRALSELVPEEVRGDSRADYSLLESGEVRVNRCRRDDGSVSGGRRGAADRWRRLAAAGGALRAGLAVPSPADRMGRLLGARPRPPTIAWSRWASRGRVPVDPSRTPTVEARAYASCSNASRRVASIGRLVRGEQGGGG